MAGLAKMTIELSAKDRLLLRQIRDALLAAQAEQDELDNAAAAWVPRRLMEPAVDL